MPGPRVRREVCELAALSLRTRGSLRHTLLAAILLLVPVAHINAQEHTLAPSALPQLPPREEPDQPRFGAIAFTGDGSFATAWKIASKGEAEAKVLADCNKFKRGACEVVSFREELCAAIASAQIGASRKVTYAGGGLTPALAQQLALARCNGKAHARCQLRTVVCGDGR